MPGTRQSPAASLNTLHVTATANTTVSIPAGWQILAVSVRNTTANAVTGGVKIGTTSGAADVALAIAVGASAILGVPDATILLKYFSVTAAQTLFIQAVTAWNSASLEISFLIGRME